jgi:methionyl-tRNA synthetase
MLKMRISKASKAAVSMMMILTKYRAMKKGWKTFRTKENKNYAMSMSAAGAVKETTWASIPSPISIR